MPGLETIAAALGIITVLSSGVRALWKIAANDGAFKAQLSQTLEGVSKTQADIHGMLQDHELRITVVESRLTTQDDDH